MAKSTTRTEEAVRWVDSAQAVAASVGFIVPRFIPAQDGHLVAEGVTLEDWIDGQPSTGGEYPKIATLLHAFHHATRGWEQRPTFASSVELLRKSKGGDVNLDVMPSEVVQACRRHWKAIEGEHESIVHGDLGADNVLITPDGHAALVDWDESRVDASIYDIAGLFDCNPGYPEDTWRDAKAALDAWEVANSWSREPRYAKQRLAKMLARRVSNREE